MSTTAARPRPDLSSLELDALLKRLHLANMRHVHAEAIARAETEQWSYRDFLALLVAEEVAHRTQTRLQRLTRRAHFPYLKTIEDFDFTLQSQLRLSLLGSYLAPDFVPDGRSLILHGKTGRGKTHLSVAIAYRAIQHGFDALFTTAAQLIEDLSNAGRKGRLHDALARYTHPHVLVIDEVGYLTYGPEAANVLYHVVNDRHLRKRPMVFTTNKPMHDWGRVLHDPDLASAILDRVLERGRWITLDGPSGRTKHLKLDPAIPQDGPGATVSGKLVPEFPEPTTHNCVLRHTVDVLSRQRPGRLGRADRRSQPSRKRISRTDGLRGLGRWRVRDSQSFMKILPLAAAVVGVLIVCDHVFLHTAFAFILAPG